MSSTVKTGIVVQARMGSTRLPGKTLMPLAGKPVLEHLVGRLRPVPNVRVVIATSHLPKDDPIEELCGKLAVDIVRGDPEDVLSRYVTAADKFQLETIIRVTGDCPLIDPGVITAMIREFEGKQFDYYCNVRPRTYPRGLDCEIFTKELLTRAFNRRIPEDVPEYVVIPYVNRHEKDLRIGGFTDQQNQSGLRWTLDEPADYEFIQEVYNELYPRNPAFSYGDVLELLKRRPELKELNSNVRQKSI